MLLGFLTSDIFFWYFWSLWKSRRVNGRRWAAFNIQWHSIYVSWDGSCESYWVCGGWEMLLLLFFSAACATLGIHQSKVWLLITFLPGFSIFSPSISNAPAAVRCAPHVVDAIIYLNGVVGVRVKRRRWHSVLCLATYTIQLGWVGAKGSDEGVSGGSHSWRCWYPD